MIKIFAWVFAFKPNIKILFEQDNIINRATFKTRLYLLAFMNMTLNPFCQMLNNKPESILGAVLSIQIHL